MFSRKRRSPFDPKTRFTTKIKISQQPLSLLALDYIKVVKESQLYTVSSRFGSWPFFLLLFLYVPLPQMNEDHCLGLDAFGKRVGVTPVVCTISPKRIRFLTCRDIFRTDYGLVCLQCFQGQIVFSGGRGSAFQEIGSRFC